MEELERVVTGIVDRLEHRFYGKYRGFVADNEDPKRLARLRVRVPSVLGSGVVTGWALPCTPYGGAPGEGLLSVPSVGAGVWVEFEEGDLEFPIWTGCFWSAPDGKSEVPRPHDAEGEVQSPPTRKILRTRKGHSIQLEDKDGEEVVLIHEGARRHLIRLDKAGITIEDGANQGNRVVLASAGVTIEDKNGNKIVLGAGGMKLGSDGAAEPLVLGKQLLAKVQAFITALNTHTHLGNMGAPTSPPSAPMSLDVPLSAKHKTE